MDTWAVKTPWGRFGVRIADGRITRLVFPGPGVNLKRPNGHMPPVFRRLTRQLNDYLAGKQPRFDLPVDLSSGTAFQQSVWRAMARIPYGQVVTYGELARTVRRPTAARAVGGACGRNPVPVIIPCHRVIGSDGQLTGFSAQGGLRIKERLLGLEGVPVA